MGKCDIIYGINPNDNINPCKVRDAIIQCLYEADIKILDNLYQESDYENDKDFEKTKYKHVEIMIRKIFEDLNGDFNNPTKESLINVVTKCKEYARLLRDKEIIEKHANEIFTLINKLE